MTVLMEAAEKNFTPEASEVIDILIQAGSDINAKSQYRNETPLMLAVNSGSNVVKRLLNNAEGVDTTLKNFEGKTALDMAKERAQESLEMAKGYAKAAKEYDRIQADDRGVSKVRITNHLTRMFNKKSTSKKDFKQESQGYYQAYFNAIKIIKMLERLKGG